MSVFGFQLPLGGGDEVDEAGLAKIAQLTGGRFFRARAVDELAGIYAEIDRLEPVQRAGQVVRPRIERYPLPLGLAAADAMSLALQGKEFVLVKSQAGKIHRCQRAAR